MAGTPADEQPSEDLTAAIARATVERYFADNREKGVGPARRRDERRRRDPRWHAAWADPRWRAAYARGTTALNRVRAEGGQPHQDAECMRAVKELQDIQRLHGADDPIDSPELLADWLDTLVTDLGDSISAVTGKPAPDANRENAKRGWDLAHAMRGSLPALPALPNPDMPPASLIRALRDWCISAHQAWQRERGVTEIQQAFGAAHDFLFWLSHLAGKARAFDPSAPRFPPGTIGHDTDHDKTRDEEGWPRVPFHWRDWGYDYALAFIPWLDLTYCLTRDVTYAARREYPAGTRSLQVGKLRPCQSAIEVVAELGMGFRNVLYLGRSHPLEPNPNILLPEAQARAAAKQAAGGADSATSPKEEYARLLKEETRFAIRERLGIKSHWEAVEFMAKQWQAQREEQVESSIRQLRFTSIDFDELESLLDREAHAVLATERNHAARAVYVPSQVKPPAVPFSAPGDMSAPPQPPPPTFAHGEDFTWVFWNGKKYEFSKGNQANSMRKLWDEWDRSGRQDGCGLADSTIAEAIGAEETNFRLKVVFRGHAALGVMIREVGKGVHALCSAPVTISAKPKPRQMRRKPKKK